jgi:hypothetical protein
MAVGRKFTKYRLVLEKLKLKQLDVYRYKDHDEIRVLTSEGKVLLIRLPKHREEMTLEEFESAVKAAIKS